VIDSELKILKVRKTYEYGIVMSAILSLLLFFISSIVEHNQNILFSSLSVFIFGLFWGVIVFLITRNSIEEIFNKAVFMDKFPLIKNHSELIAVGISFTILLPCFILLGIVYNIVTTGTIGFLFMDSLMFGNMVRLLLTTWQLKKIEMRLSRMLLVENGSLFIFATKHKYYLMQTSKNM
jgi:hypothetical protein